MGELLHAEYLESIPLFGARTQSLLESRVEEAEADLVQDPNLTVVIRTLNESRALDLLMQDIRQQKYSGEIELIVVDNESSDVTPSVARHYGSQVLTLPRGEFTYPKSLNIGMEAASHDFVFLTVGHAALSSSVTLHAGTRHFADTAVAGVFARTLPNINASFPERLIAMGNQLYMSPAHRTKKATMGVMAAQGALVSKQVCEELGGFNEDYEIGGEDTAMAGKMIAAGYDVIEEPVLAVHHTHGLGWINTARQWRSWMQMASGPRALDMDALVRRRPDLDFSSLSHNSAETS